MKRLFLFSFVILSCSSMFAQQDAQLTQNMFNKFVFNPAYAGATGNMNVSLLHRSQWVGFEGAPNTQVLSFEMPVHALSGGIGATIINDVTGGGLAYRQFNASYAFKADLSQDAHLSLGLNAGLYNIAFDYSEWKTPSGGSGFEDNKIPDQDASAIIPDIGIGLALTYRNYRIGLSSTHFAEFEAELPSGNNSVAFNTKRHYYVLAEANYELNRSWQIYPSFFLKTDQVQTQIDFAANFMYENKITAGMAYRVDDALAFMFSYKLPQGLQFGYSYDLTISQLSSYQAGSHEVFIRYSKAIDAPRKGKFRYRNNRFL
ncbi:MAG: type IX secretion system membrane protein PorP/SprF [Flavobacteriales bacterium]|nr:type IX secretion system membrane protein PorP/SprF [Flavobacteriales bacterium]